MSDSKVERGKPVLVTTRGDMVVFGYLLTAPSRDMVILEDARHVFEWADWPEGGGGVLALARRGPARGSKIGDAVEELTLFDIACIAKVSEAALPAWREATWTV